MLQPPRCSDAGPEPSCSCSCNCQLFSHLLLFAAACHHLEQYCNLLWVRTGLPCMFCQATRVAHRYSKSMQQYLHFRCTVMYFILHQYNFHWLYELRRWLDSLLALTLTLHNNDSDFSFTIGGDGKWLCNPKVPAFGEALACSWPLVLFPTCQHGAVFLL